MLFIGKKVPVILFLLCLFQYTKCQTNEKSDTCEIIPFLIKSRIISKIIGNYNYSMAGTITLVDTANYLINCGRYDSVKDKKIVIVHNSININLKEKNILTLFNLKKLGKTYKIILFYKASNSLGTIYLKKDEMIFL